METADIAVAITDTLRASRRGTMKASTVAQNLRLSVSAIHRHLDRMCREGLTECIEVNGESFYRNLVNGRPEGLLPRRAAKRDDDSDAADADRNDQDDIEAFALSAEMSRAAQMWKDRMGEQRWHDDPRALAQLVRHDGMLPPFYRQMARET